MKGVFVAVLMFVPLVFCGQEVAEEFVPEPTKMQMATLSPFNGFQWSSFGVANPLGYSSLDIAAALYGNPNAFDFSGSSGIASWQGGFLTGYASRTAYIGMMQADAGGFLLSQRLGRLMLTAGVSADKYGFYQSLNTIYGVHGSANYRLNEHFALNVFGSYYSRSLYHSPGAMPYIGQTNYGAFIDWRINNTFGVDLGVQRVYNSMNGAMETVPIVRPYLNVNKNMTIKVDVGYLLRDLIFDTRSNSNPTMAPPKAEIPIAPRR